MFEYGDRKDEIWTNFLYPMQALKVTDISYLKYRSLENTCTKYSNKHCRVQDKRYRSQEFYL